MHAGADLLLLALPPTITAATDLDKGEEKRATHVKPGSCWPWHHHPTTTRQLQPPHVDKRVDVKGLMCGV
jgi:hypothetical protein